MGKGFGAEYEGYLSALVKSAERAIEKKGNQFKYRGIEGILNGILDYNFKEDVRPRIRFHHKDSISEYYEVAIPFQYTFKDIQGLKDKVQTALRCAVEIEVINRGYYIIVYPQREAEFAKK